MELLSGSFSGAISSIAKQWTAGFVSGTRLATIASTVHIASPLACTYIFTKFCTSSTLVFSPLHNELGVLNTDAIRIMCPEKNRYVLYRTNLVKYLSSTRRTQKRWTAGIREIVMLIAVTSVVLSKCKCKLYADDLKLYSEIVTEHDCHELQLTIDRVKAWSDLSWQLEMSVGKCAFICIGHSSGDISAHQYVLGCGITYLSNMIFVILEWL